MTRDEEPKMLPKEPIPEFKNRLKEAEFWDAHDTTDFEDDWKPVEVRFADHLSHDIMVWFDVQSLEQLIAVTKARGVDPSDLGGSWIAERLRTEASTSPRR